MSRVQVKLPGIANVAIVVAFCAPLLQGCGMFGGGDAPAPVVRQTASASRPNSDCARLSPLVSNPDGSLTRAELETGLKADFKKWDKDGNGALSQAEVEPVNEYLRSLNVGASPVMDWNGDGKVDFQEYAGGWRTMFDLCDIHNQGTVTKVEMGRSPNVAPPRPEPGGDKPQGTSKPKPGGGGGY